MCQKHLSETFTSVNKITKTSKQVLPEKRIVSNLFFKSVINPMKMRSISSSGDANALNPKTIFSFEKNTYNIFLSCARLQTGSRENAQISSIYIFLTLPFLHFEIQQYIPFIIFVDFFKYCILNVTFLK